MLRNFIKPCFFCHSARVKMSLSSVLFSRGHSWCPGLGNMNSFYCVTYQEASHALNVHHHSKLCLFSPRRWGTGSLAEGSSVPHSRSHCTASKVVLLTFLYFFFFNWRKIALRCFVGFCRTAMWISYKYTHIPALLSLPPPGPSCPSRSSQSARLGSVCYTAASHLFSALHVGVHLCWCSFLHSSWPLLLKFLSLFYLPLDRGVYWRGGSEEQ